MATAHQSDVARASLISDEVDSGGATPFPTLNPPGTQGTLPDAFLTQIETSSSRNASLLMSIALQAQHDAAFRRRLYEQMLDAIASHRVADRPDRYEPRRLKRRPKPYDRLMKPRHEAKREMLNGFSEN